MSKKTKTTNDPSKFAKPFITQAAGDIQGNQANLQANADLVNQTNPMLLQQFQQGNPMVNAAQQYGTGVLSGQYLDKGNPYLQNMINQTSNDIWDQQNSRFSLAGRTGGTQHIQAATRELANSENALRYQDYGAERDRMAQQGQLTPGLTAAQYAPLESLYQGAQLGGTLPLAGSQALAGVMSPYQTNTQKTGAMQTLGTVAGLGMMAFGGGGMFGKQGAFPVSDRRLKRNVERVGELADGLGVYDFEYRDDLGLDLPEGRHRGVMADEVEQLRPWALGPPLPGGYATVDYGRL